MSGTAPGLGQAGKDLWDKEAEPTGAANIFLGKRALMGCGLGQGSPAHP